MVQLLDDRHFRSDYLGNHTSTDTGPTSVIIDSSYNSHIMVVAPVRILICLL